MAGAACSRSGGDRAATLSQGLIEGAAASRLGVGGCVERLRARFPEAG